ncbi:substrate-binding periplasmic protein [Psychromonas aquimarina]|uniref:substrate-binding periplasmic protein n=1 Tax=Psychromonas aquimarina TaxID=444919 RepID=UPI0004091B58|nr:transporter substrate-binding domain-containing protein [Psychromonas aquimarina]
MVTIKCFIITVIIAFTLLVQVEANETWKITSLNWVPYSGAEMVHQGNSIQKLRELLKKADIRLIVEFYPWKRAQAKAQEKGYVGYFPAWPEEVYDGFTASPPIDLSQIAVMKRTEGNITFDSIDKLFEKNRIGLVSTYTYPKAVFDMSIKHSENVEMAMNELLLLRKLAKGRTDAAITDPDVMFYLAEDEGISNIEIVKVIMEKELVIALKNNKETIKRIAILKKLLEPQEVINCSAPLCQTRFYLTINSGIVKLGSLLGGKP